MDTKSLPPALEHAARGALLGTLLLAVAACSGAPPPTCPPIPPPPEPVVVTVTKVVEKKVVVYARPAVPPQLLEPIDLAVSPVFVPPADGAAAVALTEESASALREAIERMRARIAEWRALATQPSEKPDEQQ